MLVCEIITLLILAFIIYQDFRYKAISWPVIPALFISSATIACLSQDTGNLLGNFLINTALMAVMLLVVTLWFSIRNRSLTNILNNYLGTGDVLFFIPVCIMFSPVNFMVFITGSLLLTIAGFGSYIILNKKKDYHIPLAGAFSFIIITLFVVRVLTGVFEPYNDEIILEWLTDIYD